MFHTKICGVRTIPDIHAVADSGADAIGLNFFSRSVRYVDPDDDVTQNLSAVAKQAGLLRIGVCVNESVESVISIARRVELDAIQLHGEETLEMADRLRSQTNLPVIRAIKLPTGLLEIGTIEQKSKPWTETGCHLLLDADAGAEHGGSGNKLDWDSIRKWSDQSAAVGWTLAGGLDPENVALAIRSSGAKSVDVASGVERPRGKKSPELIVQFVKERQKSQF